MIEKFARLLLWCSTAIVLVVLLSAAGVLMLGVAAVAALPLAVAFIAIEAYQTVVRKLL